LKWGLKIIYNVVTYNDANIVDTCCKNSRYLGILGIHQPIKPIQKSLKSNDKQNCGLKPAY
jgi:hypothetical protein